MKRCLLWGTGYVFREYVNLVKYHELLKHIEVVGVTSNTSIYSEIRGYRWISKNELKNIHVDIVILMVKGEVVKQIYAEAIGAGFLPEQIFTFGVLKQEKFDINKYMRIRKNPPTIFSNICWGGCTYHSLGLEFTSPLINMFESDSDYIKLLKNPKYYMEQKLDLQREGYNEVSKLNYPIARCGDVELFFCHYSTFEEANECWERRKKRINWDNMLIMMCTEDEKTAREFAQLEYEKKVCFVPFETEDESLIYVEFRNKGEMKGVPFAQIVNRMSLGIWPYYDMFDLVEKGEFTKIVEIN